jgi:hypothetical protein
MDYNGTGCAGLNEWPNAFQRQDPRGERLRRVQTSPRFASRYVQARSLEKQLGCKGGHWCAAKVGELFSAMVLGIGREVYTLVSRLMKQDRAKEVTYEPDARGGLRSASRAQSIHGRVPDCAHAGGHSPDAYHARFAAVGLAMALYLLQLSRARGQEQADYRFEHYQEDAGRITVDTHSWLFDKKITPWMSLKGEAVYDAISGATPTGGPAPSQIAALLPPQTAPLSTRVPTEFMRDIRWAGSLDAVFSSGLSRITPEFSYSSEHDYISYGAALNYALDLNHKNTTLNLGWAHDYDSILPNNATYITKIERKNTDEFLAGVNQLLGPKTTVTANFTFRNAHGYLDDPYRGVLFDDYPQADPSNLSLFGERRPRHRESYIGFVSLTQYVSPLRGSAEGAYRFYDDSFGIQAHTIEAAWHQKVGKRVMISPRFRYYRQTAADFYGTHFPGDPSNPFDPTPIPTYYSADYRLSQMETFTYGVELTAKVSERVSFDIAYKRYEMYGLDHVTSSSAYPKAHLVTVGARLWF